MTGTDVALDRPSREGAGGPEPDCLAFTLAVLRMHRPCGWSAHGVVPWCSCGTPVAACPYRQLALTLLRGGTP